MRSGWILAGATGLFPVIAAASPIIIWDGDSGIGGGSVKITSVDQVVAQSNGQVAAIVGFDNGLSGIVSSAAPGNNNAQIISQKNQPIWGAGAGGNPNFYDFSNLALSDANRLTFVGSVSSAGLQFGVFQYTVGAPTPQSRILYHGDTFETRAFNFNTTGTVSAARQQVNAAGQVLFSGRNIDNQLILRGGAGNAPYRMADDSGTTLANFNNDPTVLNAITPTGDAVFIARHEITPGTYRTDIVAASTTTPPATPTVRVAGSTLVQGNHYTPELLLGATDQDTFFRATLDGASNGATAFIVKHGEGATPSYQVLASYADTDLAVASATPTGQLSATGKIAYYLPHLQGGFDSESVNYYDAAQGGSPQTLAHVGQTLPNGAEIIDLTIGANLSSPMVNDHGTIVFDALLTDDNGDHEALLAWRPGLTSPDIIAMTGDSIIISGQSRLIEGIIPNQLDTDGGVFKDGLTEDDRLAFGIVYSVGLDSRSAVVMLELPEPAAATFLTLCAATLLLRRRRPR